jgi:hypothetical protein
MEDHTVFKELSGNSRNYFVGWEEAFEVAGMISSQIWQIISSKSFS